MGKFAEMNFFIGGKNMSLLIIEDNCDLVQILTEGFAENGFSVESALSGEEGLEKAAVSNFRCILLDIMLPGINGLDVLETPRTRGDHTPVIFLTARDTVEDRIKGLNLGADDYLGKPFDFGELVARVRALIRRTEDPQSSILSCGPLILNTTARECKIGEAILPLRRKEFEILELLLRHENQVFTRDRLISSVWKKTGDGKSNIIDVHIKYLRDKLRPFSCDDLLVTVRGVGYKIACPS